MNRPWYCDGAQYRSTSSTAGADFSGSSSTLRHSSGFRANSTTPFPISFVTVSLPAAASSVQKPAISPSVSLWRDPSSSSTSTSVRRVTMSSVGCSRFSAISSRK